MKDKSALAEIERFEAVVRAHEAVKGSDDPEQARSDAASAWTEYLKQTGATKGRSLLVLHSTGHMVGMLLERLRMCGREGAKVAVKLETTMRLMVDSAAREDAERRAAKRREEEPEKEEVVEKPCPAAWLRLQRTKGLEPKVLANPLNFQMILAHDERWRGRFAHNDFSGELELDRKPITDVMVVKTITWVQRVYGFSVAKGTAIDCIAAVADDNRYHPVREYLRGLAWDGVPRLHELLTKYMDAFTSSDKHRDLVETLGTRWMISAVARVMKPGCRVKSALLLIGDQNAGKSTALQILGSPWYSRTRLDLRNKDAMAQLQGIWIYELPEIRGMFEGFAREDVKAFLDQDVDRYRVHWEKFPRPHPRQVALAGTDNSPKLLNDHSGSTRYYPVSVGRIDLERLRMDRDLLWAEAVRCFDAGEQWHLTNEESALLQTISKAYQEIDPWTDKISEWLEGQRVQGTLNTLPEILAGIGVEFNRQDTKTAHRVGGILRDLGFTSVRHRRGKTMVTVWQKSDDPAPAGDHPVHPVCTYPPG